MCTNCCKNSPAPSLSYKICLLLYQSPLCADKCGLLCVLQVWTESPAGTWTGMFCWLDEVSPPNDLQSLESFTGTTALQGSFKARSHQARWYGFIQLQENLFLTWFVLACENNVIWTCMHSKKHTLRSYEHVVSPLPSELHCKSSRVRKRSEPTAGNDPITQSFMAVSRRTLTCDRQQFHLLFFGMQSLPKWTEDMPQSGSMHIFMYFLGHSHLLRTPEKVNQADKNTSLPN